MSNVSIKNVKGSSRIAIACSCGSYKCHWENYSGGTANFCSALNCGTTTSIAGGHVTKCHGNSTNSQYIVPLCATHNNPFNTICFDLKKNVMMVPVSNRLKCKICN